MNILYKQGTAGNEPGAVFLEALGVKQCYFKYLSSEKDSANITYKRHHHTHYELHMVNKGQAEYEANGRRYTLKGGHFLLLPPRLSHRVTERLPGTATLSVTFCTGAGAGLVSDVTECVSGQLPPEVEAAIAAALREYSQRQFASAQLIAASLAQLLLLLWRGLGNRSTPTSSVEPEEDPRLTMAVQYIQDNIEFAPNLEEVAAYCHLSSKHMGRLFVMGKGITASQYIRQQRVRHIELLLRDSPMSLQAISERLHFSSEFYFHAFFKKHAGMTPGEFRKMHGTLRP